MASPNDDVVSPEPIPPRLDVSYWQIKMVARLEGVSPRLSCTRSSKGRESRVFGNSRAVSLGTKNIPSA